MPWQSQNASRTRRSETPAAALRSLSVTLWYRTLAAYRMHAQTMCTLEGRALGASPPRANSAAMPALSHTAASDRRLAAVAAAAHRRSRAPVRRLAVVRCGRAARSSLCLSPTRHLRVVRSSERMICLCGTAVVLRTGGFASSGWRTLSSDSDDVRTERQLWRAPSISYPMPRAIAGAAEATRA